MSRRSESVVVTFHCRGHAGIAGTHDKTVEFTRDRDVTRRATCVLGVQSDHDDGALMRLRGDVEVTLRTGSYEDAFRATVTPFFLGDDSLVFRRGPALRGRTFAHDATKTAATIDRALVRALADPDAVLEVAVRELGSGDRRGVLFVVSTPIGNDDDLSPRARAVLRAADVVLAEDTRRFRDLCTRADVATGATVISYHEHNEDVRATEAIERLANGARVALVSDAGTPLCSDPGYVVVRRAVDAGLPVSPVPGPSALLAVLAASGLPVDQFTYAGFLPRRAAARQHALRSFVERRVTFVVHEAPHRMNALVADLIEICPDWQVCAGREMTKVFEEFVRGNPRDLALDDDAERRGEYTLVVAPPSARSEDESSAAAADDERIDAFVRALLAAGVTTKTLALALAGLPGVTRKSAYARVLALAEEL